MPEMTEREKQEAEANYLAGILADVTAPFEGRFSEATIAAALRITASGYDEETQAPQTEEMIILIHNPDEGEWAIDKDGDPIKSIQNELRLYLPETDVPSEDELLARGWAWETIVLFRKEN